MNEYKGYKLEHDGGFGMISIKPMGRGSVPKELTGTYTNRVMAMKAIDFLEANKNGKAKSAK